MLALQRALRRLGYYGARFALDGDYGPNTLGAVLACKYDLIAVHGFGRRDLGYAPVAGEGPSLRASGRITRTFARGLAALLAGERLGGQDPWLVPARAQVADADLDVRAFLAREAARAPFPAPLLWEVLAVESGANHFDALGYVKYGVDWRGASYSQTVTFTPAASSEPWVRSRGWGLAQYTPANEPALPRPMPAYITSVAANVRTAIALFRHKFQAFSRRHPCSYPSREAPAYDCRACLRGRHFDPVTYSEATQEPCSWLRAVWAYNGLSPAGRRYMERVARNVMA
ncbi:MAG: hypothetical protein QN174_05790 [Armatimonadota bacterium]|nr:hypothetical protein [Armatimonadota bacterium]MDR7422145.1 hypothetical protein [Armatimonadota bacterium]MDR7455583.1 hypothetical protein [Armatimonadota bacterium]MDR7455765.1 hypothetical protein [Armatimonadota bacterium]MDR7496451.1 hypothetical protein [Armatimonadota bacterium]